MASSPAPPKITSDPWPPRTMLQAWEVWQNFGVWITTTRPNLGPGIRERMKMASEVTADEAAAQRPVREAVTAHVAALVPPGTVLCLPTAPSIAPETGLSADALENFRRRASALLCPAGLSRHPQVSVPAATMEGCPVGLSFLGWRGGDEALLELAVALAGYFEREGT